MKKDYVKLLYERLMRFDLFLEVSSFVVAVVNCRVMLSSRRIWNKCWLNGCSRLILRTHLELLTSM